ncbi:MAG: D-xylose ABC transporter ATP-binding protein [Rhodobacteraceae bacterium]|nr:D-xylose ABC transporter ATP-binding protein [Paracoccaceae bacterium]|tara:strand:+ start:637 stop:2127 length:1491 start_codon:yes stop_codon:yes gene_type:complete
MKSTLLKMSKICKSYPGVKAVDDVSIDLFPGEVLGLMGENGAGKSTLIKMLSGAEVMDSGEIYINEEKVNINSPKSAQECGVSVIYQELITMDTLSVAENIFVGQLPRKERTKLIDWKTAEKKSSDVLSLLNSNINPKSIVGTLSIYEKQIVEVAKAIHKNAKVLIMDEPTAALSEKDSKSLFEVIDKLKAQGVGIIYISHRIEEVFNITDRVSVMRDGMFIGTKTTKSAKKKEIISMMIGRELNQFFPEIKSEKKGIALKVSDININGIIEDINFEVQRGEIVGLFGLVGSGCLNIARSIVGVDSIDHGDINIDGKKVSIKNPKSSMKNKIGFIPIDRKHEGLTLDFSVKKNLSLQSLEQLGSGFIINDSIENSIANKWVEKLEIKTPNIDVQVKNLSGGNQQKIVLGKTLETNPEILVVVEPTRGVDVGAKMDIYKMLESLCQQGVAIILVSTDVPEILSISHRVLVVSTGKIRKEFKKGEANQQDLLYEASLS